MSFDTFTLFDFVAIQGKRAAARELGLHRSNIYRLCSGERRVSHHIHDLAQAKWGSEYNLRGTVEESKRRHEARTEAKAAVT